MEFGGTRKYSYMDGEKLERGISGLIGIYQSGMYQTLYNSKVDSINLGKCISMTSQPN
jgi:hypothetical protein